MEQIVQSVTLAPVEAFNMAWEVLWPLVLGFALFGRSPGRGLAPIDVALVGDDSPAMLVCDSCAQAARRCSR